MNTIIKVTLDEIKKSCELLKYNPSYLKIDDNLFSINKITTLLKPEADYNHDGTTNFEYFGLSYCDMNIRKLYFISVDYEPTTFFEYLEVAKQLDSAQLNEICTKIFEYVSQNNTSMNGEPEISMKEAVDKMAFNEALVFLLKGVNKEDTDFITNNLWDNFKNWESKKIELNEEYHKAFKELYDLLVTIKLG